MGIRWYNKGKFEPEIEDEFEKDLNFICISNISNLYLYKEQIDSKTFILYDGYKYNFIHGYSPYFPNEKEIVEILKSKLSIGIFNFNNSKWNKYEWSNLPDEIKDRIKL